MPNFLGRIERYFFHTEFDLICYCIQAADALRITAHELQKLDVVDDIIPVWLAVFFFLDLKSCS